jgi:chromosome segregation ATPase
MTGRNISSTAIILQTLCQKMLGIKGEMNTRTLEQAVTLIAQTAQTSETFSGIPDRLEQTSEAIRSSLVPLNNKMMGELHKNYSNEFQRLQESIAHLHTRYHQLKKAYSDLASSQTKTIQQLLTEQQEGKIAPDTVQQKLSERQQKVTALANDLTDYVKDHSRLQTDLDRLHQKVFSAVPPEQRGTLLPPISPEAQTTRRLG